MDEFDLENAVRREMQNIAPLFTIPAEKNPLSLKTLTETSIS